MTDATPATGEQWLHAVDEHTQGLARIGRGVLLGRQPDLGPRRREGREQAGRRKALEHRRQVAEGRERIARLRALLTYLEGAMACQQ